MNIDPLRPLRLLPAAAIFAACSPADSDRRASGAASAPAVAASASRVAALGAAMPDAIVVAINHQRFGSLGDFNRRVAQAQPGSSVALLVRRGDASAYR